VTSGMSKSILERGKKENTKRIGSRCSSYSTESDKACDEVCSSHNRGWFGNSVSTARISAQTFGFLLDTETLMTDDAIDLDDLQKKCTDFATAFLDDVDGARLVDEIQDCRILVSRRVGVDVSPFWYPQVHCVIW